MLHAFIAESSGSTHTHVHLHMNINIVFEKCIAINYTLRVCARELRVPSLDARD